MNSSMRTGKKHKSNVLNKQGISSLSIQRRLRSGVTNPVELKILAEQHECVQQIITELINAASAELQSRESVLQAAQNILANQDSHLQKYRQLELGDEDCGLFLAQQQPARSKTSMCWEIAEKARKSCSRAHAITFFTTLDESILKEDQIEVDRRQREQTIVRLKKENREIVRREYVSKVLAVSVCNNNEDQILGIDELRNVYLMSQSKQTEPTQKPNRLSEPIQARPIKERVTNRALRQSSAKKRLEQATQTIHSDEKCDDNCIKIRETALNQVANRVPLKSQYITKSKTVAQRHMSTKQLQTTTEDEMASHLARLTKLHAEVKLKHINPMYNGEHRHRKSQFSSSAVTVLPKISHR